ncbi:hypothetical protein HNR73_006402 [Phytomonospora endophytica]|uniref:Uncharacterized protein n=1 Tax=Phytomonospora endophytica TaxID=714109 RepID=A0A841FR39_9ACTN|nr:hypothetical protein [Phytomonospora endophytica]
MIRSRGVRREGRVDLNRQRPRGTPLGTAASSPPGVTPAAQGVRRTSSGICSAMVGLLGDAGTRSHAATGASVPDGRGGAHRVGLCRGLGVERRWQVVGSGLGLTAFAH